MTEIPGMFHEIVTGKVCPYCGRRTSLADSAEVYHGRSYGMMYICHPCGAYVGCHRGTTKALGRVANAELRQLKNQAHEAFDRLWKDTTMNRHQAYRWLQETMGIDAEYCHIGMFDEDQCRQVIELANGHMEAMRAYHGGAIPTRKVLFLDIDGVLVTLENNRMLTALGVPLRDRFGSKFDSTCIEYLKQITNNARPDIVITSTWKMELGLEGLQEMWRKRNMPGRLVDVTPNVDPLHRGNEIQAWLDACGEVCQYVIIDDAPFTDFFREEQLPFLFKVEPNYGLDSDTAQRIVAYLGK